MCLLSKKSRPKFSLFGKVGYKVLLDLGDISVGALTCKHTYVDGLNIAEHRKPKKWEPNKLGECETIGFYDESLNKHGFVIDVGFLHAYSRYSGARTLYLSLNNRANSWNVMRKKYKIVKVILPPFSKYYENIDGSEFCAEKLIVKMKKSVA